MPITRKANNGVLINDYSLHSSMRKVYEINERGNIPLLFIDELNRSEFSVQQELMQLLLAREINGNKLPESTLLMAAGNLEYDSEVDYQVNVMNPALKDRLTIIEMKSDSKAWIEWGSKTNSEGESHIHPKVLAYIATQPEMLHKVSPDEDVAPTPRSWEKASNMLKEFENGLNHLDDSILIYALTGTVGGVAATGLMSFISSTDNPLISFEDVFIDKPVNEEFKERVKSDTITRLFLSFRQISEEVTKVIKDGGKLSKVGLENFNEFLKASPRDTMYGMISALVNEYEEFLDLLASDTDEFLELHARELERIRKQ